eukprot:Sspe_Gene.48016::Locus_24734_Transcript_1_1_Confidence_1.000_Length_1839::g.48016::m.48016
MLMSHTDLPHLAPPSFLTFMLLVSPPCLALLSLPMFLPHSGPPRFALLSTPMPMSHSSPPRFASVPLSMFSSHAGPPRLAPLSSLMFLSHTSPPRLASLSSSMLLSHFGPPRSAPLSTSMLLSHNCPPHLASTPFSMFLSHTGPSRLAPSASSVFLSHARSPCLATLSSSMLLSHSSPPRSAPPRPTPPAPAPKNPTARKGGGGAVSCLLWKKNSSPSDSPYLVLLLPFCNHRLPRCVVSTLTTLALSHYSFSSSRVSVNLLLLVPLTNHLPVTSVPHHILWPPDVSPSVSRVQQHASAAVASLFAMWMVFSFRTDPVGASRRCWRLSGLPCQNLLSKGHTCPKHKSCPPDVSTSTPPLHVGGGKLGKWR